jgi:hypothetical protein
MLDEMQIIHFGSVYLLMCLTTAEKPIIGKHKKNTTKCIWKQLGDTREKYFY